MKEWKKYFLSVKKFVLFWLCLLSASTEKTGNLHHSALVLPNQGSWVMKKSGGVQILFLSSTGNVLFMDF